MRDIPTPSLNALAASNFKLQLSCRLLKWDAKTWNGVSFVPALLKTLEENLQQRPVYQDSPKDAISDFSLEIELVIPFAPNQLPSRNSLTIPAR
ncbi:hypothetical protein TNCV_2631091 [Trichonephila clavipes]|nr:hypothetical protein TNCV_2631091 [Trichonephila clavipes]